MAIIIKEIVVDISFGQTRVAVLEDNELVEIYMEGQEGQSIVGNIYKGLVENVLPGMGAAFIDIGTGKNAFLYVKDVLPDLSSYDAVSSVGSESNRSQRIEDYLKAGQEVLIQIIKDPIGSKGARATTHVTLPGRFAVLMPTADYIGVSRRIEDEAERERLKALAAEVKPTNMGVIVRTAGEGCTLSDLKSDIEFLSTLWANILGKSDKTSAPKLIHKDMSLFFRIVRDMFTKEIDKLTINNKEYYEKALEIISMTSPDLEPRVSYFDKCYEIFDYYKIEEKIEKIISKKVWLKSGGYIVIDQTEALTAIDVNTGKYVGSKDLHDTVLKTNIEAAKEIAKQLRLRDIGGIIIIDFIDMNDQEHENLVLEVLRNALKKDKNRSNVLGMTHLGLVEMTRKKVVQPKTNIMQSICPYCSGTGKVLSKQTIFKKIEFEINKALFNRDNRKVEIYVHPELGYEFMSTYGDEIKSLSEKYNKDINIIPDETIPKDEFRVHD
ncbi:Rne/Rng family ribonuclease [Lutispora thermophila]|uniref:Rne/Rng family ribonuclease n=1 Tax=Lutispora thermophila TaxID=288966 RepID=UPI001114FB5A|nr:Rne/Rng family ribonuclease [Lutispora thermophila]